VQTSSNHRRTRRLPLTPDQEAQARLLTPAQLQRIDECLLSHVSQQFRKVAYVIGQTMKEINGEFPGIPDVFYGLLSSISPNLALSRQPEI
jgi:hypothetical protein